MGLGKSLTCISLLYTLLNHPSLISSRTRGATSRSIRTVLLVAPTNVISHWEAEFNEWTGKLEPSISTYNLGAVLASARPQIIGSWARKGGVLLVTKDTLVQLVKDEACGMVSFGQLWGSRLTVSVD